MEPLDHKINKPKHVTRIVYLYPPNKDNNYCIFLVETESKIEVELGDKYYYGHFEYEVVELGYPQPSCSGIEGDTLTVHYAHKVGEDRSIDPRNWWDKIQDKVITGVMLIIAGVAVGFFIYKLFTFIQLIHHVLFDSN